MEESGGGGGRQYRIETNIIASFDEMHGFFYEFQAISSAKLYSPFFLLLIHYLCVSG